MSRPGTPMEATSLPTSLYPGLSSPAKPVEIVSIYASGFGQTTPPIADRSVSQFGTLSPQPVITVGGVIASVQFAGVVSPGLYQFSVVIPKSATDGDNLVVATYAGRSTQPLVLISVQH